MRTRHDALENFDVDLVYPKAVNGESVTTEIPKEVLFAMDDKIRFFMQSCDHNKSSYCFLFRKNSSQKSAIEKILKKKHDTPQVPFIVEGPFGSGFILLYCTLLKHYIF